MKSDLFYDFHQIYMKLVVFGRRRGTETYCRNETDPIELSGGSDFVSDYWNWQNVITFLISYNTATPPIPQIPHPPTPKPHPVPPRPSTGWGGGVLGWGGGVFGVYGAWGIV